MKSKPMISKRIICMAMMLSFTITGSYAQIVNIPDANFKAALIAAGVDKNNDGEIQQSEAEMVDTLKVALKKITSLEGIEAFTNLSYLDCMMNELHFLHLSKNLKLVYLSCEYDHLTTLDVANLPNLRFLHC